MGRSHAKRWLFLTKNNLPGPFVHRDSGGGADVDRAGGAEAFDEANVGGFFKQFSGDAVIFGAKN